MEKELAFSLPGAKLTAEYVRGVLDMIFDPTNTVRKPGSFSFAGQVKAEGAACLCGEIFAAFWRNCHGFPMRIMDSVFFGFLWKWNGFPVRWMSFR